MSTNDDNRDGRDEELFGELFASLGRDTPAPDPEFRRKLHEKSLAVFAAQFAGSQTRGGSDSTGVTEPRAEATVSKPAGANARAGDHTERLTGRARMIRFAWRSAAVAAAAGIIATLWMLAWPGMAPAAEPTLGDVLSRLG